jgi:hypothetical protein
VGESVRPRVEAVALGRWWESTAWCLTSSASGRGIGVRMALGATHAHLAVRHPLRARAGCSGPGDGTDAVDADGWRASRAAVRRDRVNAG